MASEKKSTDAFDAALKNALRSAVASDPADCPSPEILAAYYDRTLSRAERARVDSHLASCARCPSMLASIARADEDPSVAQPVRNLAWITRLLAPVAIVAVVIAIAIGVRNRSQPPEVIALNSRDNSAVPIPAVAPPSAPIPNVPAMGEFRKSQTAEDSSAKSASVAAQGASVESAPAMSAPSGGGAAKLMAAAPLPNQISSPDGSVMWRFGARGEIMRSGNSRPWLPMRSGATADILAASAPSNDVAWFVGNSGTIVRTRDGGATWQTVRPPKNADFTSITASDSNNATVSTASGESFVTRDGGVTWSSP